MYNCEKSKKNPQNLSFSSTLLDEIYRSIDGGENESFDEFKLHRSRQSNERSKSGVTSLKPNKASRTLKKEEEEEEEKVNVHGSFRRHWVSEKVKAPPCRRHSQPELYRMSRGEVDFDPVPFSSSSSSSDSSSGGLSTSDVEFISVAKSRVSCFTVLRPKPGKTSTAAPSKTEKPAKVSHYNQSDGTRHPFDEMPEADGLIKSKLSSLKIYNSLKKAKQQQPISPGSGRLTSFLNSLFSINGGNPKKTKNSISSLSGADTTQPPSSTCSSASSYYRSCLTTTKEKTNEKYSLGEKKTKVRFDNRDDSKPCGNNSTGMGSKIVDMDDDDDELSDSSSDLFELDHLAMDKYGEELPVYETTHVRIAPNRIVR